jgi:alkylhydroperoxidase family enzyme
VSKLTPLPAWHQLARRYDDQQLIELVLCIGAYTMVAGFLNRLKVATMRKLTIEPGSD